MKIRTKKKMNLPELIKHVWENEVFPSVWRREESPSDKWAIHFFEDGMFRSYNGLHENDTFTVTVEEELTEDTEFEELWEAYWNSEDSIMMTRSMSARMRIGDDVVSINGIKSTNGDIFKTVAIFYKDTLIWSAESGIPETGVLEVEADVQ